MLEWYKRFCCGLFYFFREKAKSDIPLYATFMFTVFLYILLIFGIDSFIYFLLKSKYNIGRYFMYGLVIIFAVPNFLLVFKNRRFLEYYEDRLSVQKVILLILLIFFSSLTLILIGGRRT